MSDEWFIERSQQVAGPFTSQQLKELAASGRLTSVDGIRKGPVGAFVAASKARGLFEGETKVDRPDAPDVTCSAGISTRAPRATWLTSVLNGGNNRTLAIIVALAGSLLAVLMYVLDHSGSDALPQKMGSIAVVPSGPPSPDPARGKSPSARHVQQPSLLIPDARTVALSPDGNLLFVAASGSNALWDLQAHRTMKLSAETQWSEGAFSHDSKKLASYVQSEDNIVVMSRGETDFEVSGTYAVSTSHWGTDLSWSPDNRHVVVARTDGRPIETKWFWRPGQKTTTSRAWIDDKQRGREGLEFASLEPVVLYAQIIDTGTLNQPSLPLPHYSSEDPSRQSRGPDRVAVGRHVKFTPAGDFVILDVTVNEDLRKGVEQKRSIWFDIVSGDVRHTSQPVEGMSQSGKYYVTFEYVRTLGNTSWVVKAVNLWLTKTHERVSSVPLGCDEEQRHFIDVGFSSDEETLFIATPSDGECKRDVYSITNGAFVRSEESFTATRNYPLGVRQPWQILSFTRGPMELWAQDHAWPSVVLGTSDGRSREAEVSQNGTTVVARFPSEHESHKAEVWRVGGGVEVGVLGFRQEYCDESVEGGEHYFTLTEEEKKSGWQLPLSTQIIAPKVSKERYRQLREGMTAEQAYDVLGGLPHKMLLKMSLYESGPYALRGIHIIDRYHVYAGELPDSVVILHLRKDAELTNHRGVLVSFSQRGL